MNILKRKPKLIQSEITLGEILELIDNLLPVKVMFNDIVLYNDYDSEVEIEEGVYGEMSPPLVAIPDRIKHFKNSIVENINIKIIQHHHSIIKISGLYIEEN